MEALVQKLVEAWGPSGYEHHVRALIEEEVKDLCDDMSVDVMGNLVCRVGEKTDNNVRIMIAAHMDEIGLMVSHIDRNGFLRFSNIGGLMRPSLMGNRVKFEDGTIGTISVHDEWGRDGKVAKLDDYYIDVSLDADADGKQVGTIKVGDPAIMWETYTRRDNRMIAKSMDDRIGCVVAIETMRKLKETGTPNEVVFVFTVQEEVGIRGARTSTYNVDPDIGIALDVTSSGDVPKTGHGAPSSSAKLGHGAAIKVKDGGHLVPPLIRDWMVNTATEADILYQLEVLVGGSTDGAAMLVSRAGVPTGTISVPCRYVHSTSETVDVRDVQACIDLTTALVSKPVENYLPQ